MRNRIFMHTSQDDCIMGTMRFVSKDEYTQVYGALIPTVMTTPKIRDSPGYHSYLAFATRAATPKTKRICNKPVSPMTKTTATSTEETHSKKKSLLAKKDVLDEPKGKSSDTSEETGLKPEVLDVSKADSFKSEYKTWGDSGDEANEQRDDEDVIESDDDHEHADDDRIESDNARTNAEPDDEDKDDKEMTNAKIVDAKHENVIQESAGNQVKDDVQATQKTKVPLQSFSISSYYATKYLNFDNIPPVDTEVVSMLDINVQHEVLRTSPLLTILVSVIPEHNVINTPKTITTASATTISSLLTSLFPHLL
nr:hypothetical protein [Tanacetum cinerariifolium]